jgi:GT2 family glycosyltransferase
MDVSVIVATRNRESQLKNLLVSLQEQHATGLSWEVIVIDNGSADGTRKILEAKWERLTLIALHERVPGKARALNTGLDVASGDLVIFRDDDTTSASTWLAAFYHAAVTYKTVSAFCGPIIPDFPEATPAWLRAHPWGTAMFGRFVVEVPEGPLPRGVLPFGANFGVRASALTGMRFRLDLGPSADNGSLMCEDSEFVARLRDRGEQFIYLPSAGVEHHLTKSHVQLPVLCERAFHLGRSIVIERESPPPPLRHYLNCQESLECESDRFERALLINFYCGQLYQLQAIGRRWFVENVREILAELGLEEHHDVLVARARHFMQVEIRNA